jgi:outer membrane protein
MNNKYLFYCMALIAFVPMTFAQAGFAAVEIPSSEPSITSPGQPISKATTTGGDAIQAKVLTLNQCIDIALKNNPTVRASMFGVDVNQSRVGAARSGYYPQLNASGSYARVHPQPNTVIFNTPAEFDQYLTGFSLNQTILDFGKTSQQVDISKYNLESSRSDLNTTQDTIILSVKQAYYGVLQARRNRDVAADVLKQFQLHLDQAKGFYDVGTKARIDVIKAEVDLSNAKLSLINAENALKIAWVTLGNVMGTTDVPEYAIEDNLSFQKYAITSEEAMARAFENRSDLKSIIAKRQAAETNISYAQSGYYPVLSGFANYNWAGQSTSSLDHYWNYGLQLTVPLFSGFLTQQQSAEAKSNLYILRANEDSLRQQVLLDVRQAYLNLQAAEASIATAELAAAQAKENLDLANGRYAAGVGSPIEVSDAFTTYVAAQANYTSALSNYKIAQATIEKSMGAR